MFKNVDSGMMKIIGGLFLAFLVLAGAVYLEEKEWQSFSVEHECKVTAKIKGSVSIGTALMADGNIGMVTTATPSKTGYECNDGVTYYR